MALRDDYTTTTVHLPMDDVDLLRLVAYSDVSGTAARPSVSEVVRWLINRMRPELERKAGKNSTLRHVAGGM